MTRRLLSMFAVLLLSGCAVPEWTFGGWFFAGSESSSGRTLIVLRARYVN